MALSKLLHSQSSAPINPDGLRPVQPNEFLPPVAGWVTFGSLAMLAISGSAIALAVASQDIGQVKIGQPVTMKVSSCPYTDYGTVNGQITTIAPDLVTCSTPTIDSAIQDSSEPSSNGYYEVTVQSPVKTLNANHQTCYLQAGIDGTVDIITRQETALIFLMRKLRLLINL